MRASRTHRGLIAGAALATRSYLLGLGRPPRHVSRSRIVAHAGGIRTCAIGRCDIDVNSSENLSQNQRKVERATGHERTRSVPEHRTSAKPILQNRFQPKGKPGSVSLQTETLPKAHAETKDHEVTPAAEAAAVSGALSRATAEPRDPLRALVTATDALIMNASTQPATPTRWALPRNRYGSFPFHSKSLLNFLKAVRHVAPLLRQAVKHQPRLQSGRQGPSPFTLLCLP